MQSPFQIDISVPPGSAVLQSMMLQVSLSAEQLQEAAEKGAVWVSLQRGKKPGKRHRLRSLETVFDADALISLNYNREVLQQPVLPLQCVNEQRNYGIWYKPSGMLCQGSKWSDHTTITQAAATQSGKPCYLVHRLDKAAQGLVLLAYTKNATRQLCTLFEQRQVEKHYHVWIAGSFDHALPLPISQVLDDKAARSVVQASYHDATSGCTRLKVLLETGRKHQLRKHLAGIGCPVLGDRLYGKDELSDHSHEISKEPDFQLLASSLSFICPFIQQRISHTLDVSASPFF